MQFTHSEQFLYYQVYLHKFLFFTLYDKYVYLKTFSKRYQRTLLNSLGSYLVKIVPLCKYING